MSRKYEVVIIFDTDLGETELAAELEKISQLITSHSGTVERTDTWGRRQLAYPMKKKQYGTYVVLIVSAEGSLIADLRRQLKINDQVLRVMVVDKDQYAPDFQPDPRDEAPTRKPSHGSSYGGRRSRSDEGSDGAPAAEKPAAEKPAAEKSAEEKSAEEKPAEEKPEEQDEGAIDLKEVAPSSSEQQSTTPDLAAEARKRKDALAQADALFSEEKEEDAVAEAADAGFAGDGVDVLMG